MKDKGQLKKIKLSRKIIVKNARIKFTFTFNFDK